MPQVTRARVISANSRQGFSLVELSIVVAIISVIATSSLEIAVQFLGQRYYTQTIAQVSSLDVAIDQFYQVNGRLPCPAKRDVTPLDASRSYGLENCSLPSMGGSNGGMMAGIVPFRTLSLPPSSIIDPYGSRINYYVTRNLTNADGYDTASSSSGTIVVRSGTLSSYSTLSTSVAYAVFSNGPDKRGAVNKQGVANLVPCATTNDTRIDAQNCLATAYFGSTNPGSAFYVIFDSRYNNGAVPANFFDDAVAWRERGQL